jgi:WD40 repeat protein
LPDGRLASGSVDCTIRLWAVGRGSKITHARISREHMYVDALSLQPDGRLASVSGGAIQLWDMTTGAGTARLEAEGYLGNISAPCPLPDGRLAFTFGGFRVHSHDAFRDPYWVLGLWDPMTGAKTETARSKVTGVMITLCARCLTGGSPCALRSYDVAGRGVR